MGSDHRPRALRWAAASAAALAAAALLSGLPAATPVWAGSATCPPGQVVDDEATDFGCRSQCPEGMMVDATTGVCVAAPGVPPAPPGGVSEYVEPAEQIG
ncbi:hypothetical protein [Mycolicibacterium palauense]|uniref:hypothetical protein n=1 Tax=Mycolicibacterium palauense TaxID=2034511 RepID=UPI000BFEF835|nr:hypothetical protein [Mycolicibacterium palauense]